MKRWFPILLAVGLAVGTVIAMTWLFGWGARAPHAKFIARRCGLLGSLDARAGCRPFNMPRRVKGFSLTLARPMFNSRVQPSPSVIAAYALEVLIEMK